MGLSFRSAEERAQFAERLAQGRDEDASREEQRTANRDFSQVYPKGWTRIRALLNESKSRAPLLLYTFIAEHMDADGGALVVDQETLCEALGVSRTTLWRAITFLEERNALLRVNVGGSVSAYALTRPRSGKAGTAKRKRLFSARKLLFARAARTQVKRRMQLMLSEGQPELPPDNEVS